MASLSETEEKRLAVIRELTSEAPLFDANASIVYMPSSVVAGILKMREFPEAVVLYDVLELVEKPDLVLKKLVDREVLCVIASARIDGRDWSLGGFRDLLDGVGYTVTDHRTEGDWQAALAIF